MANNIGWGKGASNNSIGWGNVGTNGFGSIYSSSNSGETDLAAAGDPNFIIEVDTTLGDGLNQMRLPIQGTQPMTVDWGDGTVETITQTALPSSANWVTHSYASGGVYEIKVSESLERVYFNRTGDAAKAIKILNWGDCVWSSFQEAFSTCNLTELPTTPILNGENITTFRAAFLSNELTSIPKELFDNCPNVTNFAIIFQNNNLTSIPAGLFDSCPNVTTFDTAFRFNQLTSIPAGLFDSCPNVTNFGDVFILNQLTSIPAGLFDNCPNVTDFSGAFRLNQLTSIPAGLFDNCPNVTNFGSIFSSNTLPVNDLSRLYIELSLFQTQNNVPFDGGSGQYDPNFTTVINGTTYTTGVERSNLITRGWTLTDGGAII
jgi:hypothetical protein